MIIIDIVSCYDILSKNMKEVRNEIKMAEMPIVSSSASSDKIYGSFLRCQANHLSLNRFYIILKVFSKLGLTDARLFRHNRLFHIG